MLSCSTWPASRNNHAEPVGEVGRREEALEAIAEAVTIRRGLAEARPDAFLASTSPRA